MIAVPLRELVPVREALLRAVLTPAAVRLPVPLSEAVRPWLGAEPSTFPDASREPFPVNVALRLTDL